MVLIPKTAYDRWIASKDSDRGSNEDTAQVAVESQVKDDINDSNTPHPSSTATDTVNNAKVTSSERALQGAVSGEISSSNVIDKFPYKYKLYAKRLLAFIKKHGAGIVEWNDDGTFVYRGSAVEGSDIAELIIHLFKTNRLSPTGLSQFRKCLDKIRVPKAFIKPYLLKPPGTPANIKKKWVKY